MLLGTSSPMINLLFHTCARISSFATLFSHKNTKPTPISWGGNFRGATQFRPLQHQVRLNKKNPSKKGTREFPLLPSIIVNSLTRCIGRYPSRLIIGHSGMESYAWFIDSHRPSILLRTLALDISIIALLIYYWLNCKMSVLGSQVFFYTYHRKYNPSSVSKTI